MMTFCNKVIRLNTVQVYVQGRTMDCFSFLRSTKVRSSSQVENEADLVLKSLELLKRRSQNVPVFPGLRSIHTKSSLQSRDVWTFPNLTSMFGNEDGGSHKPYTTNEWQPLYILIEKGMFKGKPLPLPEPPHTDEEDEHCLIPPLCPRNMENSFLISHGFKLKCFRFEEIATACCGFSSSCCIRESAFGKVYRCLMHVRDGRNIGKRMLEVAVLRLNEVSHQSLEAWITKVKWISKMQHRNVCKLIGFCTWNRHKDGKAERILVFEHYEYGSLDLLLSKSQHIYPLNWYTRLTIALGAAKGLAYLHNKAHFQVIYTNLTAANVLIDKDFTAKLSDYGLCLHESHGKFGWDDYIKNDIGNFGLILLELLMGSKNMKRLIAKKAESTKWIARTLRDENKLQEIVDSELKKEVQFSKSMRRLAAVALRCLRRDLHLRPSMNEVVSLLEEIIKSDENLDVFRPEYEQQVLASIDINKLERL